MESSGAATTGVHKSSGKAPRALCPGGQQRSRGHFTGLWAEWLLLMLRCAGHVGKCLIVYWTTQSWTRFFSCNAQNIVQDKPPSRLPPAGGEVAVLFWFLFFLVFFKKKKTASDFGPDKQPPTVVTWWQTRSHLPWQRCPLRVSVSNTSSRQHSC